MDTDLKKGLKRKEFIRVYPCLSVVKNNLH
jgi:hypothetical protein